MRYKALLLDFYGTLVAEDDFIISDILQSIAARSHVSSDVKQIGRDWRFQELCALAYADNFKTQQALETESLTRLLADYQADLNAETLSERLFAYWRAPEVFEDGTWFVQDNRLPVCIVSNIDTDDLRSAIASAGWYFEHLVTSESCRSYKPRPEMFFRGLEKLRCERAEVLHIGDSLASDVTGAQQLGIDTAWVNRKGRTLPKNAKEPTFTVANLRELRELLVITAVPERGVAAT